MKSQIKMKKPNWNRQRKKGRNPITYLYKQTHKAHMTKDTQIDTQMIREKRMEAKR